MKKVDIIIDLQYGSTGKGLIAGYLAETKGYDTVINANMPNAGHTYINDAGRKWIHKVLPNGIVSPNLKRVMIGPGSVFCPERMQEEIAASADLLKGVQILIHPNAIPLQPMHKQAEQELVAKIGSTGQGSMMAMVNKMLRDPDDAVIARDALRSELMGQYVVTHNQWRRALDASESILAEAAQGFSLGISERFYPYCTSRDCTPSRFMSDMGIPHTWLNKVIGTARTYPIRVAGNSGAFYGDQVELGWADINQPEELTTVTQKVRRLFTFSEDQMYEAIWACQPDEVFLNFCNYMDVSEVDSLVKRIDRLLEEFGPEGASIRYMGHGPSKGDVTRV